METTARPSSSGQAHSWRFFRAGGLDLVRLENAGDFRNLQHLDQKLWTALACPVKGLEFDEKTLALIDTDKDGRVRAREILAAVNWLCDVLEDPAVIVEGTGELAVAAIKDAALAASAREILASLGKAGSATLSLGDVADTAKIFAATKFNGDGVVIADSAGDDAATKQVIADIVATLGGVPDRCGVAGVDAAKVAAFFAELAAYDAWNKQAETDGAKLKPAGDGTAAALAAVQSVRAKVDDYFARCRLAAYDARALGALNRQESEYLALAAKDLSITVDEIAGFPIARVEAGRALPLDTTVNPAWAPAIATLKAAAVDPILGAGKTALTEAEWSALKAALAAFEAWSATKAGAAVAGLGLARVREILASKAADKIGALIEQDKKLEAQFAAISGVEKLLRFHRDLYRLLMNFVSFSDLYDPKVPAIFQAGTLYLDARSCDLCIRVDGPNPLVPMSKTYVAYCSCTRPGSAPMTIAACFTQGDSDYLFVGRHGIFYDRQGRDWDAVITSIVDNPISIRQAFWAPYKKLLRMIEEQVAKRAAAAEAASDAKLAKAATDAAHVDKTAAAAPAAPPKKVDIGAVAAIGVAISGAISALTLILGYVFGLKAWQYPLVLVGIVLVISGPAMIIAALKLRQRTLGPILDGNGWAVNGRVKINIPFGTSLTERATLPPGSQRTLEDPFAEKGTPWGAYIVMLAILAAAAIWIRWDATKHDGKYFWMDRSAPPTAPAATPEAPAQPTAPAH
ncbi:MAG: hypothetical protein IAE82_07655 [Opitutaceae bacterium]|nr:hypothetical protein [Opitutaceae bacterium]